MHSCFRRYQAPSLVLSSCSATLSLTQTPVTLKSPYCRIATNSARRVLSTTPTSPTDKPHSTNTSTWSLTLSSLPKTTRTDLTWYSSREVIANSSNKSNCSEWAFVRNLTVDILYFFCFQNLNWIIKRVYDGYSKYFLSFFCQLRFGFALLIYSPC